MTQISFLSEQVLNLDIEYWLSKGILTIKLFKNLTFASQQFKIKKFPQSYSYNKVTNEGKIVKYPMDVGYSIVWSLTA